MFMRTFLRWKTFVPKNRNQLKNPPACAHNRVIKLTVKSDISTWVSQEKWTQQSVPVMEMDIDVHDEG